MVECTNIVDLTSGLESFLEALAELGAQTTDEIQDIIDVRHCLAASAFCLLACCH